MTASSTVNRRLAFLAASFLLASPVVAGQDSADGLAPVKGKHLDQAYVLPGADFRPYTAILLDPVDAVFAKNWQRDYNSSSAGLGNDLSDADAARILAEARAGAAEVFTKAFAKAGYRMADAPGPDVLRVRATISDIRVNAPDTRGAGRSRTYAREAGSAKLQLEALDSVSGKLLGRATDSRDIGDSGQMLWARNSVTNSADFERAFTAWANAGVKALAELKAGGNVPNN